MGRRGWGPVPGLPRRGGGRAPDDKMRIEGLISFEMSPSIRGARGAGARTGVDGRRVVTLGRAPGEIVLAPLHSLDARVGDARGDEADRANGVVVAGHDEID